METVEKVLAELRRKIDGIDDQILSLLNQRALVAQQIGQAKAGQGLDFYNPGRELAVFERLVAQNCGPFPADAVKRVFREIISASLSLEQPMKVAFLGPSATFTHQAAQKQFGFSAQLVALKSIPAVFEEVRRGRADFGVVPVENTTEGIVSHTLDMFVESDLVINAEILMEISHDLLSVSGRMEDVGRVLSHPQALAQCRHWLEENLADVPLVDAPSTAMAARQASEDPGIAAIASEIATSLYGLRIIKSKIQDNTNNLTRFLVVGRTLSPRTGQDKTSVMFIVADQPGILCRMLEPFSRRNINLTKIESRPIKSKAWEYVFFLDLEGHAEDAAVSEALADLQSCCRSFKILGSYPRCR
jgi:chorismate mutase/prephenate dehydratase